MSRTYTPQRAPLVVSKWSLETLRKSQPDAYRAVIIALTIVAYPTHVMWTTLDEAHPAETPEVQYALQAAIGVLAAHGGEVGVRLRPQLLKSSNYEYACHKWLSMVKPASDIAYGIDVWRVAGKSQIDHVVVSAIRNSALQDTPNLIKRNLYNIARTLLQYVVEGRYPLSTLTL